MMASVAPAASLRGIPLRPCHLQALDEAVQGFSRADGLGHGNQALRPLIGPCDVRPAIDNLHIAIGGVFVNQRNKLDDGLVLGHSDTRRHCVYPRISPRNGARQGKAQTWHRLHGQTLICPVKIACSGNAIRSLTLRYPATSYLLYNLRASHSPDTVPGSTAAARSTVGFHSQPCASRTTCDDAAQPFSSGHPAEPPSGPATSAARSSLPRLSFQCAGRGKIPMHARARSTEAIGAARHLAGPCGMAPASSNQ
jgi:hypothetical protein